MKSAPAIPNIRFILIMMAIAIGVACGLGWGGVVSQAAEPVSPDIVLQAADEGRSVELSQGQMLAVSLDANPATGYRWEVDDSQGRLAAGQTVIRQSETTRFEALTGSLPRRVGAPVQQRLSFLAQREGQDTVRLVYRRPWEPGVPPTRLFSFQVRGKGPFIPNNPAPEASADGSSLASPVLTSVPSPLDLSASFNWCALGKCTPIKDQGRCGSCWAFSTVAPLEANILIHDGVERDLSEQYLISGNRNGWSCSGGDFAHDYHLAAKAPGEPDAGAVYEADFPYQALNVPLNPPHAHHEKIASWGYVDTSYTIPTVSAIKQAILNHGPVSAAVCVGAAFQSYRGGVFQTNETCSYDVNHAIALTGWDDATGSWVLRNSWGSGWGEGGYMRIKYGTSKVGYGANYVVYNSTGDITPPTGTLTQPADSATLTADSITLQAQAADEGVGVDRVEFSGWYDGSWHLLGQSNTAPYYLDWDVTMLTNQPLWLAIDIVDKAGNRTENAGGYVYVMLNRPAPTMQIEQVWTTRTCGVGGQSQGVFTRGEGLYLVIRATNQATLTQASAWSWQVTYPDGTTQFVDRAQGTTLGPGESKTWCSTPWAAPTERGEYTFTGQIAFDQATRQVSKSAQFQVTLPLTRKTFIPLVVQGAAP
jgi:predicted secreted protein